MFVRIGEATLGIFVVVHRLTRPDSTLYTFAEIIKFDFVCICPYLAKSYGVD